MSFAGRREFLFVYSVKDNNPNGDPLNANHPRYDAETSQVLVSDVRIKRTIRDQWLREGLTVFVDGETKTIKKRIDELKKGFNVKTGKEALKNCIDTRLFGVTFALGKDSFSWTGPVQFKWGRSLNKCKTELVQGTAAFATKENSEQRSFRNEYTVPFTLIGVYGIANQYPSKETGATEGDLDKVAEGLWQGTVNLITRSKVGHMPRVLFEIKYQAGFAGAAGALDERLRLLSPDGSSLTEDEELAIRSPKDCILDITGVGNRLADLKKDIELIKLWTDSELKILGIKELESEFGDKIAVQMR
jgi:CRISPR-associated protein Csh2